MIYRSLSATDPVSLQRTRNPVYWKSARFALRRLEDLAAGRWSPELGRRISGRVCGGRRRRMWTRSGTSPGSPGGWPAPAAPGRVSPPVVPRPSAATGGHPPTRTPGPGNVVSPPADKYWADPFVFESDGETLVFIEQVRRSEGLAVGRLERGGELSALEPILRAPTTCRTRPVLRDGGQTFMIPESSEAGRVELWAAADFPTGWTRAAVLLEGVTAVDASVMRHGGMYWMWVNQSFGWPPRRRDLPVLQDRPRPPGFLIRGTRSYPTPGGTPSRAAVSPRRDAHSTCPGLHRRLRLPGGIQRRRSMSTDDYRERPGQGRIGRSGAVSAPTPTPSTAPGRRRTAWDRPQAAPMTTLADHGVLQRRTPRADGELPRLALGREGQLATPRRRRTPAAALEVSGARGARRTVCTLRTRSRNGA